jgi:anaerobic ribonucleoside-triphosphate reductase activating protein
MTATIRIGRTLDRTTVLGPGVRAALWVTGCHLRCRECTTPEFLDFAAGRDRSVTDLAVWIDGLDGIDGITLSGGEPFEQAEGLNALLDHVATTRPELSTMAFTGYRVEALADGDAEHRRLLGRLDIVVDGPYLPERHSASRWRGSENQRVIWQTDRHRPDEQAMDVSAGVEVLVDPGGSFAITGVPPTRGFRRDLRAGLAAQGIGTRRRRTG